LAALPPKYIHAPWLLTAAQQQMYQVSIGVDYPSPIVDHAVARGVTLALFKSATGG
jgi:deoxyribodipyrimidine photo-lyase